MMTVRKVNPSTEATILARRSSAENEPTCLLGKAIAVAAVGLRWLRIYPGYLPLSANQASPVAEAAQG